MSGRLPERRLGIRFGMQNVPTALVAVALAWSGAALAQAERCGDPFRNHFGPWDYRNARAEDIRVVENAHFTPRIEQLQPGERVLGDDLSYTLSVFPNHHRALLAITRLAERLKVDKPEKSYHTVDCWYDRAVRFRPDDTVARGLYAQYLTKQKRRDEALYHLGVAVQRAGENGFSHYNIGLLYLELGEFDKALQQAHRAMALDFPRSGLADQLKKENKWREPSASGANNSVGVNPAASTPPTASAASR